jgi:hypothetical protein
LCVHTQVSRVYASVTAKITPSPHKGTTSFPAMAELVKPRPGSKLVERRWWLVLYITFYEVFLQYLSTWCKIIHASNLKVYYNF